MTKQCRECGKIKPLSGFYIRQTGQPRSLCKQCWNVASNERKHVPWTYVDDDVIRDHYPAGGWAACNLPGRTKMSIMQRAYKLGVGRLTHVGKRKTDNRERFGLPADDRPDEIKALDVALRSFRACEPAANLTWILGSAA